MDPGIWSSPLPDSHLTPYILLVEIRLPRDMPTEQEIVREFEPHSTAYFSKRREQSAVTALIVYWIKNDIAPGDEINGLRDLFEAKLGYTTLTFAVPEDNAQLEFNREIFTFVTYQSNHTDNLISIYHVRHYNPDED